MKLEEYDRSKLTTNEDEVVLQFIDEMLDASSKAMTPAQDLYDAFCLWTKTPVTQQRFGRIMGGYFEKRRVTTGTLYHGVTLVDGAFADFDVEKEPLLPERQSLTRAQLDRIRRRRMRMHDQHRLPRVSRA